MMALLVTSTFYGQYNKWAIEADFGLQAVNDESAIVRNQFNHLGLGLRYNINPKFGLALTYGRDALSLYDLGEVNKLNTMYNRLSVEAYIELFDILDLQNNYFTMLLHGGGGLGFIDNDFNDYNQTVLNIRGGVTGLFKVSRVLALKVDVSTSANLNQERTLDGAYSITNAGTNSSVDNVSVGAVFYLGKKKDGKCLEHADWYVAPEPTYTIVVNKAPDVTNVFKTTKLTKVIKEVAPLKVEYVFFDNDSHSVSRDGLNAITKTVGKLSKDTKVYVTGYASPPASSDYNVTLSRKRAEAVVSKLRSLGVSDSQIVVEYNGEVDTVDSKNVDLSRRVQLLVK